MSEPRFLADSMVGKLARWLRLLGYDARYGGDLDDEELLAVAAREGRILLTRDRRLVQRRACRRYLLIVADDPWDQVVEVVRALGLRLDRRRWFRRCLDCNRPLDDLPSASARGSVPPYVAATQRRFARCRSCGRIYWPGTHVEGMWERLSRVVARSRSRTVALLAAMAVALAAAPAPVARAWSGSPYLQEDPYREAREALLAELRAQGISDPRVLEALAAVPRHRFVPAVYRHLAYANRPLPIGLGQTISQPYIVALMTELLGSGPEEKVLEVGTGSGYQAAVLAELGCRVYTIEIIPDLAQRARRTLAGLGYERVHIRVGDGYLGWPEEAPFDAIIVTAAPAEVPPPLVEQLRVGGRLVIPVGPEGGIQQLLLLVKEEDGRVRTRRVLPVRFVPLVRKPPGRR